MTFGAVTLLAQATAYDMTGVNDTKAAVKENPGRLGVATALCNCVNCQSMVSWHWVGAVMRRLAQGSSSDPRQPPTKNAYEKTTWVSGKTISAGKMGCRWRPELQIARKEQQSGFTTLLPHPWLLNTGSERKEFTWPAGLACTFISLGHKAIKYSSVARTA